MNVRIFDQTACTLGEGPLWHPTRNELFWFDITGQTLFAKGRGDTRSWRFDEPVSAAGWVDRDTLLVASASALMRFDIASGATKKVVGLEADNRTTRSNDGRGDPWGGFWIGTMGLNAEPDAGAIYRYYRGELRQLFAQITIPNSICFSPDRKYGFFTDTTKAIIWRQMLDANKGWPVGEPEKFIDFTGTGINPDGSVFDSGGYLWNAQWGASRVARYTPEGMFESAIALPSDHITCPAFGGDDLCTLFITSAREGLNDGQLRVQPGAGKTYSVCVQVPGQPEHQVIL